MSRFSFGFLGLPAPDPNHIDVGFVGKARLDVALMQSISLNAVFRGAASLQCMVERSFPIQPVEVVPVDIYSNPADLGNPTSTFTIDLGDVPDDGNRWIVISHHQRLGGPIFRMRLDGVTMYFATGAGTGGALTNFFLIKRPTGTSATLQVDYTTGGQQANTVQVWACYHVYNIDTPTGADVLRDSDFDSAVPPASLTLNVTDGCAIIAAGGRLGSGTYSVTGTGAVTDFSQLAAISSVGGHVTDLLSGNYTIGSNQDAGQFSAIALLPDTPAPRVFAPDFFGKAALSVDFNVINPVQLQPTIAGRALLDTTLQIIDPFRFSAPLRGKATLAATLQAIDPLFFAPALRGKATLAAPVRAQNRLTVPLRGKAVLLAPVHTAVSNLGQGTVTITGTVKAGQTLTATYNMNDPDGGETGIAYQWYQNITPLSGKTSSTYDPQMTDVGQTLKCRVTYTDGNGNAETVFSANTAAVAAPSLSASFNGQVDFATGTTNPLTAAAFSIGTASADRYVVVSVYAPASSAEIASVTVGGISCTAIAGAHLAGQRSSMWIALVPTGTTANIVATYNATPNNITSFGVHTITGGGSLSLVQSDVAQITGSTGSSTKTFASNVNGVVIGMIGYSNAGTISITGSFTQDGTRSVSSNKGWFGHVNNPGSNPTLTLASFSGNRCLLGVSYSL